MLKLLEEASSEEISDALTFPLGAEGMDRVLTPHRVPSKASPHGLRWHVPASDKTVHWGFFSKSLSPILSVKSGADVTIECITNNASDDYERFIKGDAGAESIFHWTRERKNVDRRGAGPLTAPQGAGGGKGAQICTGPIYIEGAEPGDVVEVRIIDMYPRRSANPRYRGKAFGVNIAGRWGYHRKVQSPEANREVLTLYEIDTAHDRYWARPLYSFRWKPVRDPFGVVHHDYDYLGIVVDHNISERNTSVLKGVRVPLRPHFGVLGVAPSEAEIVSSGPPNYTGGNIDNWRLGKGATLYLPVAVKGALLSVGDTHAAQGDGETAGSAIESSWTGLFRIILHKRREIRSTLLEGLDYPLIETRNEWIIHGFSYPNYLTELGPDAGRESFANATLDMAMADAYRKTQMFLGRAFGLTEDECVSLIAVGVDFGVTQAVDANLGVHAILNKRMLQFRRLKGPNSKRPRRRIRKG
jgi:acetamidase/formamidase